MDEPVVLNQKLCKCGCGAPVENPAAWYIRGHSLRKNHFSKIKAASATETQQQVAALAGFDLKALGVAIAQGVVEGMKAAEVEKNRVSNEQKERARVRTRAQLNENRRAEFQRWKNCSHMRSHPYSGTSRVAWAQQSDGLTRGTCMGCGCPFSPIASELPFPEMVEWYRRMIAVPQTVAANDFLTGMVAAGSPA